MYFLIYVPVFCTFNTLYCSGDWDWKQGFGFAVVLDKVRDTLICDVIEIWSRRHFWDPHCQKQSDRLVLCQSFWWGRHLSHPSRCSQMQKKTIMEAIKSLHCIFMKMLESILFWKYHSFKPFKLLRYCLVKDPHQKIFFFFQFFSFFSVPAGDHFKKWSINPEFVEPELPCTWPYPISHLYNLQHLITADVPISVQVIHAEGPFELLLQLPSWRHAQGNDELPEVYRPVAVCVESSEHMLSKLGGITIRKEIGINLLELFHIQGSTGAILQETLKQRTKKPWF